MIEYKREAYDLFNKMMYEIQSETVRHLFRAKFGFQILNMAGDEIVEEKQMSDEVFMHPDETGIVEKEDI